MMAISSLAGGGQPGRGQRGMRACRRVARQSPRAPPTGARQHAPRPAGTARRTGTTRGPQTDPCDAWATRPGHAACQTQGQAPPQPRPRRPAHAATAPARAPPMRAPPAPAHPRSLQPPTTRPRTHTHTSNAMSPQLVQTRPSKNCLRLLEFGSASSTFQSEQLSALLRCWGEGGEPGVLAARAVRLPTTAISMAKGAEPVPHRPAPSRAAPTPRRRAASCHRKSPPCPPSSPLVHENG